MMVNKIKKIHQSPIHIVLGFIILILIGSILLSTSYVTYNNEPISYIDALFTSTSAVCVTGLAIYDTGSDFNIFGQIIILILIQLGGLGILTLTCFLSIVAGKKLFFSERKSIIKNMSIHNEVNLRSLISSIIYLTLFIEFLFFILFSIVFVPEFGIKSGLFKSAFHSVSAFCNAGFDIIGDGQSMASYANNYIINIGLMIVIILGGLGYIVINDLFNTSYKKITYYTKLVLKITLFLILFGFITILIAEWNNPATIGNKSISDKILISLFASVTPRTAGFSTINYSYITPLTYIITILFMIIGGSPNSTAGGIKTTTAFIIFASILMSVKNKEKLIINNKEILPNVILRCFIILIIIITISFLVIFAIHSIQPDLLLKDVTFEVISATGTVGLSTGITSSLTQIPKILIILCMFIGRIGFITIIGCFISTNKNKVMADYPEGKILIG